jgi:CheY-like chemotaxis protein
MRCATQSQEAIDVLIVEDDPITRMALRQLLEGEGYTCAEAEDGREAVEIARLRSPRLLLLDLMMPELDGFSVAEQLRADPKTRAIPIHCLTGLDFPAARRAAKQSGCEVFLTKPLDVQELLEDVMVAMNFRPGNSRVKETCLND